MKEKLIKILIPAVGGQGGGLLTEWLLQALETENYDVQSISLPGLAQRGGSTTYYIEAYPLSEGNDIIFSQFPMPGDIDLILSQEFLELGRMLEKGYGSEDTVIISSTHRMYSTEEKLPVASGIYEDEKLHDYAKEFSKKFIGINTLSIAKQNGMNELASNAILFGALSASSALPLSKESFHKGIEKAEVSVKVNKLAFELGYNHVVQHSSNDNNHSTDSTPAYDEMNYLIPSEINNIDNIKNELFDLYPEYLWPFIEEALFRLTDYQGFWYAESFVDKFKRFRQIEAQNPGEDYKLSEYVIKNLALLMTYEDGIRVSELKIRDKRFERIRKDMQIRDDQVFEVVDYLKPEADEIYGLMPDIVVRPVLSLLNSTIYRNRQGRGKPLTVAQKPVTTSFLGFLRIWLLSKLKFLRPSSYRYRREHETIDLYLDTVEKFGGLDYKIGLSIAKSGSIIKGYGRVRRRTIDSFKRLIKNILEKSYDKEKEEQAGLTKTAEIFNQSVQLISQSEDGIDKAEELLSKS